MIYFFHHYELPAILQQGHFQHILFRPAQQQPTNPAEPTNLHRYLQIRGRFSQFFSAVRPSATTQTSTIAVTPVATVATSTSTITSSSVRSTVTVGTNVQPINTSQSIQTVPASMETTESQTSTGGPSVAVSIQTNDEGTRPPPHGGPDQP
ncbi:hypothetical protein HUJ04_012916 [Dendroctonus ponderosae]|nr:hypothetical protein HUJ04_012916 [Dendroctonus ponderosae]